MAKDFYLKSAKAQMQNIQTQRAAALADLEAHRLNGDKANAGECVQRLADLAAAQENLQRLANQYVQSLTPPAPPEVTREEREARPWDRMDWRDVVEMTRKSKYASDIKPDDPNLIAGWQEAQRRRARGE